MCSNWSIPLRDVNTVLNICFSAAWLAGVACIIHLTYQFVSKYTYVTVNCWFCNVNVRVPFKQKNEWFCPHCQQFNGFTRDGDYSKPIPEQHNEDLNVRSTFVSSKNGSLLTSNGLCRICNANQELKIKQIASYVPLKEEEYDWEIEQFRRKLEKSYKLCPICERTVQSTLKLKSRLYSSKIPVKTENYLRRVSLAQPVHSRSWKYLFLLILVTVLIVSALKYNFISYDDFSAHEVIENLTKIFQKALIVDQYMTSDVVASIVLAVAAILAIKLCRGRISFLGSVLFGFIACATHSHLTLAIKISGIVLFTLYSAYKCMGRDRRSSTPSFRKHSNKLEQSDSEHENNETSPNDLRISSNEPNINSPLCGKLSGLHLGQSRSTSSNSRASSYLFRSSRRLIQPPRLKLDDSDQPSDSSPTVSSGYESGSSFLRKSPDDVSEFDSISQVNSYRGNLIRNERNALSRYYHPYRTSYFPAPERYYGASLVSSSANQCNTSSSRDMNAFYSTVQIFLCSLAFFILGFSLQLLIAGIKF